MDPAAFVPLGRIVKTHGLAGEVSVAITRGLSTERLLGVRVWFVPPPREIRTSVITGVRPGPKGPLVKLEGVDGPDAAALLRGTTVMALESDVPLEVLPRDEEPDPVGLRVADVRRGDLGVVTDVIVTGANDVWVVEEGPFGQVLIPDIPDVIDRIDWDDMTANVRLLPGLIEDE